MHSLITTFSGNASDIYNVYKSSGISGLGNEEITINNTTVDASLLNTLDGNTTGNIDASAITTFSGNADIYNVYKSSGISGLGNEEITINDTTVDASHNTLDGNTTGNIDASLITTFSGNASDIYNAYKSSGISGLGNEEITISNTTVDASLLNNLDGSTTGNIDASLITTFSGNASDIYNVYKSSGISGLGNEEITINNTTVDASHLTPLMEIQLETLMHF